MVISVLSPRHRTVLVSLDEITDDFDCTLGLDFASATWQGITLEGAVRKHSGLSVTRDGITLTSRRATVEVGLPPKEFRKLMDKLDTL
jgi:hypothetical protein